MAKAGLIVICASISPYAEHRRRARNIVHDNFHSVFVDVPLETCKIRDKTGLYQNAEAHKLKHFIGINEQFEIPENADLILDNSSKTIIENVNILEAYVDAQFVKSVKQGAIQIEQGDGI